MQRLPVYRLTFASIFMIAFDHETMSCRYARRRNPDGWIETRQPLFAPPLVDPARSGIGRTTPAGPKPTPCPPPVAAGGIAARPWEWRGRVTSSPPAPTPPRRNALRCIRGRDEGECKGGFGGGEKCWGIFFWFFWKNSWCWGLSRASARLRVFRRAWILGSGPRMTEGGGKADTPHQENLGLRFAKSRFSILSHRGPVAKPYGYDSLCS